MCPDAHVMVVENADRFGLSQLHQLRGRVGRGSKQSYCVLLGISRAIVGICAVCRRWCGTRRGFQIAEVDLKLRGHGAV